MYLTPDFLGVKVILPSIRTPNYIFTFGCVEISLKIKYVINDRDTLTGEKVRQQTLIVV